MKTTKKEKLEKARIKKLKSEYKKEMRKRKKTYNNEYYKVTRKEYLSILNSKLSNLKNNDFAIISKIMIFTLSYRDKIKYLSEDKLYGLKYIIIAMINLFVNFLVSVIILLLVLLPISALVYIVGLFIDIYSFLPFGLSVTLFVFAGLGWLFIVLLSSYIDLKQFKENLQERKVNKYYRNLKISYVIIISCIITFINFARVFNIDLMPIVESYIFIISLVIVFFIFISTFIFLINKYIYPINDIISNFVLILTIVFFLLDSIMYFNKFYLSTKTLICWIIFTFLWTMNTIFFTRDFRQQGIYFSRLENFLGENYDDFYKTFKIIRNAIIIILGFIAIIVLGSRQFIKTNEFNNFIIVFSSISGGLLTLGGVAWTINRQEQLRQEEQEVKDISELNKVKPIIVFAGDINYSLGETIIIDMTYNFKENESIIIYIKSELEEMKLSFLMEMKFFVANNADGIIQGLLINNNFYELRKKIFIKKEYVYELSFNNICFRINEIKEFIIVIKDLHDNWYNYEIVLSPLSNCDCIYNIKLETMKLLEEKKLQCYVPVDLYCLGLYDSDESNIK